MARKKNDIPEIVHGEVTEQPICDTLEKNYMPYAMSVIISRAIPEIDGLKPAHRKLLSGRQHLDVSRFVQILQKNMRSLTW